MNGFNASLPATKPKTRIGRVLTELTSDPPRIAVEGVEDDVARLLTEDAAETLTAAPATQTVPPPRDRWTRAEAGGLPHETPGSQPDPTRILTGRDRLAALRERLALAARPRSTGNEPKHTAAAVRELIEELRGRLEAAVRERSEIAGELEDTRAALARAGTELERERRSRADVEAQAEERGSVADEAVAEAETLAAERDLMLAELAERRRLDDEQAALVAEAEAALDRHRAESDAAARDLAEMRNLLDLRAMEIADRETRLKAEAAKRAKVEARCHELEAEIARLAEATEALDTINGMVARRR